MEKTKSALEKIVNLNIAAAQPTNPGGKQDLTSNFIRYTPSQQAGHSTRPNQRIIRMTEMPTDPLEPPKFKHKKVPRGPPSPPVPVMHSPPRKVTAKDQQDWKIPPCISNWKNN
jgi:SNW domain-containing protein 1